MIGPLGNLKLALQLAGLEFKNVTELVHPQLTGGFRVLAQKPVNKSVVTRLRRAPQCVICHVVKVLSTNI